MIIVLLKMKHLIYNVFSLYYRKYNFMLMVIIYNLIKINIVYTLLFFFFKEIFSLFFGIENFLDIQLINSTKLLSIVRQSLRQDPPSCWHSQLHYHTMKALLPYCQQHKWLVRQQ